MRGEEKRLWLFGYLHIVRREKGSCVVGGAWGGGRGGEDGGEKNSRLKYRRPEDLGNRGGGRWGGGESVRKGKVGSVKRGGKGGTRRRGEEVSPAILRRA